MFSTCQRGVFIAGSWKEEHVKNSEQSQRNDFPLKSNEFSEVERFVNFSEEEIFNMISQVEPRTGLKNPGISAPRLVISLEPRRETTLQRIWTVLRHSFRI